MLPRYFCTFLPIIIVHPNKLEYHQKVKGSFQLFTVINFYFVWIYDTQPDICHVFIALTLDDWWYSLQLMKTRRLGKMEIWISSWIFMEPVWLAAKLQTPAKIPWAFKWTHVWIISACGADSCFHQVFLDRIIIYRRRCQHLNYAQKKNLLTFSFIIRAFEQLREQKQKSFLPFDLLKKVNRWRKFRQTTPRTEY